jgi:arylsulfatase A-like enzyme
VARLPLAAPWGFGLAEPEEGASRGGHGSTREMRVPLLISGAAVRAGAAPRDARLVDVAPTIAALLGVRPPADAQGRVLDGLLYG